MKIQVSGTPQEVQQLVGTLKAKVVHATLEGGSFYESVEATPHKKRHISAAGREAISIAQRKRWSKQNKEK